MSSYVKDAGVWKPALTANASRIHIKDGGVWKLPKQGWAKDAGVWKPLFPPRINYLGYTLFPNPGNQDFTVASVTVPDDCILVATLLSYGPVSATPTAMTVDGSAGTLAIATTSNNYKGSMGYKAVSAGTHSVTMSLSGGNGQSGVADAIMAFWAVTGYRSGVPVTQKATGTATFASATMTVPNDSATIWALLLSSNPTRVWSLATENQYVLGPSGGRSFALALLGYNTPGSYTETVTLNSSNQSVFLGMNFT
ncbi:hypothetical protein LB528_12025 [Mesorhizobium sp. CA4]|nr:hypothetical protein [Mesorhizobium sp. CA4]